MQRNVYLNMFIETLVNRYEDKLDTKLSEISYDRIYLFTPREILEMFSLDHSTFQNEYITHSTDISDIGVIVFRRYFEYLRDSNIKTIREAESARSEAIQDSIDADYFESEYS